MFKSVKALGSDMSCMRAWKARWIEPAQQEVSEEPSYSLYDMFVLHRPAPDAGDPCSRLWAPRVMKRAFSIDRPIAKATLFMTAHGVYLPYVNGKLATEAVFAPDYTSYDKLMMYQAYDVTELMRAGTNVWGATLADGWYAGRISTQGNSRQYGNRLALFGELELRYEDGSTEVICTDRQWHSSTDKYVYADIQIGEMQDLRQASSWAEEPAFDGWDDVREVPAPHVQLVPQLGPQVVRRERLAARAWWREKDALVIDFGQVIAGRTVLSCYLADGQRLRIEHAETLDAQGHFFMNIVGRNKDATDVFIGRGSHEVLEPDFTFHGFRYARITGWDGDFDPRCIHAVVLRSDICDAGSLVTSDARVNQLISNVMWSQRGNMLSIPTDCPQRERMGWTGDIQVYAPTGCFFQDLRAFLIRWLDQVMADQLDDGQVLDYSPATKDEYASGDFTGALSSAGWGDAIVLVPWSLYRVYGDEDVLSRCYDAMLRWHAYCRASAAGDKRGSARYIWDTKPHYGDWMQPSALMDAEANPLDVARETGPIVATAYLAYVSTVLAKISHLLGHEGAAEDQRRYADAVREAFAGRFSVGKGKLAVECQGAYVLALAFDLLPSADRAAAARHLAQMIVDNGKRLDTGFLSMPYLLDVLERFGYGSLAEDIFWQGECPSWLYEVDHGATTIWENWAGIAPDGTVGPYSFNHYSFGCVASWIVRRVGGLVIREPGYRTFNVSPRFVRGLDFVRLEHKTSFGPISVAWNRELAGGHRVEVAVPAGTAAYVTLPKNEELRLEAGEHVLYCD